MSAPKDKEKIKRFATWLNIVMKDKGYDTAYKLCKASGISSATASRIFNFESLPEQKTIEKIAIALEMPIDKVMLAAGYPVKASGSTDTLQREVIQ
jgi:transcriptional regulator with XRE-family HTH domain